MNLTFFAAPGAYKRGDTVEIEVRNLNSSRHSIFNGVVVTTAWAGPKTELVSVIDEEPIAYARRNKKAA